MQRRQALIRGDTLPNTQQQDELYDTEVYEDYIEEGD